MSKSDVYDCEQLRRILRFVYCNIKEKGNFGATNIYENFTYVDASYTVHHGMRSHTGGTIYMGLGVTKCRSSKKKLNTKISTESELVGRSDYVPYNIWYIIFMNHQGYLNDSNMFIHETKSP